MAKEDINLVYSTLKGYANEITNLIDEKKPVPEELKDVIKEQFDKIYKFILFHLARASEKLYLGILSEFELDCDFSLRALWNLNADNGIIKYNPIFASQYDVLEIECLLMKEIIGMIYMHPMNFIKYNKTNDADVHNKLEDASSVEVSELFKKDIRISMNENSNSSLLKIPKDMYTIGDLRKESGKSGISNNDTFDYYYKAINSYRKKKVQIKNPLTEALKKLNNDANNINMSEVLTATSATKLDKIIKDSEMLAKASKLINTDNTSLEAFAKLSIECNEVNDLMNNNKPSKKDDEAFIIAEVKVQEFLDKLKKSMQSQIISMMISGNNGDDETENDDSNSNGNGSNFTQDQLNGEESNDIATPNNSQGHAPHQYEKLITDEQTMKSNIASRVISAYNSLSTKDRGAYPAGLLQALDAILKPPEIKWQQKVKNMIGSLPAGHRKTRSRLNRRQPGRLDLCGQLTDQVVEIVAAMDTSGSVSDKAIKYFLSEIMHMTKDLETRITVIECDAEINKIYKVNKIQDVQSKVSGRGGTWFSPVIDLINGKPKYKKKFPEYAGKFRNALFVYFTDGFGESEIEKPRVQKTLWVVLGDSKNLSVEKPYGEVCSILSDKNYDEL